MTEVKEAEDSFTIKEEMKEEDEEGHMESRIQRAMRSRIRHFKEQSDSLTFEGVRRLLEKDLGLQTYDLDVHKRFIKQCLLECLNDGDDDNGSKSSAETMEKNAVTSKEVAELPGKEQMKNDVKEASSEDEEKTEDSPVMGLLTGHKKSRVQSKETEDAGKKKVPSKSTIKEAIKKRVPYIKANSDKITMAGVRRLLEKDLGLDNKMLDPFKKFVSEQLDEILNSPKISPPATGVKKTTTKNSHSKASKKFSSEGSSDSLDGESEDIEDNATSKKKVASKGKVKKSEEPRKRKRPAKEATVSSKKRGKQEETSEEKSDAESGENAPEDDQSQSSAEKPVKKKEVVTPAYGKQVEHLKSIIKSCGMSVPPAVYKRAKQVSENKREGFLIKELEDILSREGLSAEPSEKEIKEVRKRKERAKELEGIDMSNIVSSTRRRSTTSFISPPKPKVPVKSDDNDAEDTESGSDDGDGDDDDEEDDDNEDGDDSQSEEFNEDEDDDDSD
ncbi:Ubiquitinyl hydrolase 1 [Bertholletia excelsa]